MAERDERTLRPLDLVVPKGKGLEALFWWGLVSLAVAGVVSLIAANFVYPSSPPSAAVFSALLVLGWLAAVPTLRARLGERAVVTAALAFGSASLPLLLFTLSENPRVVSSTSFQRAGLEPFAGMFLLFVAPMVGVLTSLFLGARIAQRVTPRGARWLRGAAWGALVAAGVLVGGARRAEVRPGREAYFASLHSEATLAALDDAALASAANTSRRVVRDDETFDGRAVSRTLDEVVVRGMRLQRACTEHRCVFRMERDAGHPLSERAPAHGRQWVLQELGEGAVRVLRDEARDRWIIDQGMTGGWPARVAFEGATPVSLHLRDLRGWEGPPRRWVVAALAGVLFALALLLVPVRTYARPLPGECEEGEHRGEGKLWRRDGSVAATKHPYAHLLPVGPVLWMRPAGASDALYRMGTEVTGAVVAGTLRDLELARGAPALARTLFALATLALTNAPLVAAAMLGLVF